MRARKPQEGDYVKTTGERLKDWAGRRGRVRRFNDDSCMVLVAWRDHFICTWVFPEELIVTRRPRREQTEEDQIRALELQGLTRSDAQGVVEARQMLRMH